VIYRYDLGGRVAQIEHTGDKSVETRDYDQLEPARARTAHGIISPAGAGRGGRRPRSSSQRMPERGGAGLDPAAVDLAHARHLQVVTPPGLAVGVIIQQQRIQPVDGAREPPFGGVAVLELVPQGAELGRLIRRQQAENAVRATRSRSA
jgi:hypothetical protein